MDWRMQAIEDDLTTLHSRVQGGTIGTSHERAISNLELQVQELRQHPLWNDMQKTAAEVHQMKERFQPVMRDIELRLTNLERPTEISDTEGQIPILKEKFRPAMQDIEKRLIALESRPIESTVSNISFAEEPAPTALTTLIERIQVLEAKVNNLEPSLSTLHSSISSTPLDPPKGARKGEGSVNDPSVNPLLPSDVVMSKRLEALEAWVKSYLGGVSSNTLGFTIGELGGRLLKRIASLETQLTGLHVQELPKRQRELETKLDKLLQTEDLPSFGASMSSKSPTSLELRVNKMELNQDNLVSENKRLQARITTLEESRNLTTIRQIMDRYPIRY